jgi:tyrosyl-tRNA synthetase
MVAAGVAESRSAARRAIAEGGAYVNNERVTDEELALSADHELAGGWIVVRRGKRSVGLVRQTY